MARAALHQLDAGGQQAGVGAAARHVGVVTLDQHPGRVVAQRGVGAQPGSGFGLAAGAAAGQRFDPTAESIVRIVELADRVARGVAVDQVLARRAGGRGRAGGATGQHRGGGGQEEQSGGGEHRLNLPSCCRRIATTGPAFTGVCSSWGLDVTGADRKNALADALGLLYTMCIM